MPDNLDGYEDAIDDPLSKLREHNKRLQQKIDQNNKALEGLLPFAGSWLSELPPAAWYPAQLATSVLFKIEPIRSAGFMAPSLEDWKYKATLPSFVYNIGVTACVLGILGLLFL